MPSLFKGRPIHHYAGQDDETLRAMGLEDSDMEEVRHRLRDSEYDEEMAREDAERAVVASDESLDGREWVTDPLVPIPGSPDVYVTSTIDGLKPLPAQLEEARFNQEFERREELVREMDEAERQGAQDVARVEKRNAEAEVRAVEAEIDQKQRRLQAVKERAADAGQEGELPFVDRPSTVRASGPVPTPALDARPAHPKKAQSVERSKPVTVESQPENRE